MFLNNSDSNTRENIEQVGSSGSRQACLMSIEQKVCRVALFEKVLQQLTLKKIGELQEVADLKEHSTEKLRKAYI